ncbi:DUF4112 domain-containing protein [Azospirillum soli]|uniref:DUF4112 domain-containing protein n=1 Tax=Azospirillum soli TaxID=1304799 RepID=UPI001AE6A707|nr:DUF4112 domain-containing protein [Azospirillum soli]MBP2312863.1 hypothetical protein [Azospirillum soli]
MTEASFSSRYARYSRPKAPLYTAAERYEAHERLEWLAWAMDNAVRVPGTNIRLGADALLGLVPGVGNIVTTAVSGYLIREAWRLGVPRRTIARMVGNVALDSVVSAVPVVGNVADVFWKANRKNMEILNQHLGRSSPSVIDGEWRRMP